MPILGEVELIEDDLDSINKTVNVDEEQIKINYQKRQTTRSVSI